MIVLLALLWCVYLSECFVRRRPGEWLYRPRAFNAFRASIEPEIQLLGGRIGLSWSTFLPWMLPYLVHGDEFDIHEARTRRRRVEESSRWLRVASGGLFVWIMGGVTLLILTDRLTSVLIPYAIAGGILWAVAFATFVDAFRRVHGRRPALEVWLTAALSPVSLMRGPQSVCTDALKSLHPVTAAAILVDDAEFLRVARLWHFDRPGFRRPIEHLARSRNLLERLTAPPASWDAGLARYCPRCHETYAAAAERCADCAEVQLQVLPARS